MTWYARYVNDRQTGVQDEAFAAGMARMSWVEGDLETGLSWTDTDPGQRQTRRHFELRPISDEEAADWERRYPTPRWGGRPPSAPRNDDRQ